MQQDFTITNPPSLSPVQRRRREKIERIWREANGYQSAAVELIGGESEWAFWERLLTARWED